MISIAMLVAFWADVNKNLFLHPSLSKGPQVAVISKGALGLITPTSDPKSRLQPPISTISPVVESHHSPVNPSF